VGDLVAVHHYNAAKIVVDEAHGITVGSDGDTTVPPVGHCGVVLIEHIIERRPKSLQAPEKDTSAKRPTIILSLI